MIKSITRKVYDANGESSVLGIPCKEVTDYWCGTIDSDGVHIDDAFDVEEVDVKDSHSTGLVSLVAKIAKVQQQERCIPTDFTKPIVKGQPFKNGDECDWNADEVTAEVEEVELTAPITIEGIPVKRLWKATGVSFTSIKSSVIMDGRSTMNGYSVDGASDVVYKVIPNNPTINALVGVGGTSEDVEIDAESGEIIPTENANELKYELYAAMAKKAMDGIIGIGLVGVGKNEGVSVGVINAMSIGIPTSIAVKHFKKGFYNTDGLVFMLDMCHKCSAEKWTDIVGNNEFIGSGVTLQDGVPYFNGSAYMSNSGMAMHNSNTHTIEVVYKGNNASYSANHLYREDFTNGLCAGMYGNLFITITGNSKTTYNVGVHNIVKTVSVSNVAVSNGTQVQSNGTNNWGGNNTNKAYIGSRYDANQCFTGKIASIRIYNRLLSADEMIANQAIDLARFSNL